MNETNPERRIILITGATSGIGREAAFALAKQGAHVIIHGRNTEKTDKLKQEIIVACGHLQVDTIVADLFLLAEVRLMAQHINERYRNLDILINNAGGIMGTAREETLEGREKTVALNLFAPFLLTELLLDKLKKSSDGRIINVSSVAHKHLAKPDFYDIENKKNYSVSKAYGDAKLFLILISQKLSRQLKADGITNVSVNTLHPGLVASNFLGGSGLGSLVKFISKISIPFSKTPAQGAETIIYLALSKDVKGVSGKYFDNCKPVKVSKKYDSVENENLIWDYCEEVTAVLMKNHSEK
ncbi:SDR family NAD(P)-dependent oxidoreductase [Dyadobacter frigoris]|uniref:SDR family NAD(P)-dependent oxidoreductase n=1 Tax=Dyadobacter frigoris TaxID=2576211 RepID=A0A4U6CVT9_9BACT|nr:SDR family NAD(P)-dependent oxidoreductase [Dyadobacter frigoris]TKT88792.1 SDR family NAD(P)-dependent oxidoreductase [Dyadobacter frigoris]GLU53989.1 dehydrogenase [Dyadobacter frigoris]